MTKDQDFKSVQTLSRYFTDAIPRVFVLEQRGGIGKSLHSSTVCMILELSKPNVSTKGALKVRKAKRPRPRRSGK